MLSNIEFNKEANISTAENLASEIRKLILNGTLKPGTKLKEEDICKQLHVSRTPLREAFRMLQSESLVSYTRYVGVSVAELSAKFVEDNWDLRALLECYAAKQVVFNATKEEIEELYKLKKIMLEIKPNEIEKFEENDKKFHLTIARLSGNSELENLIIKMWDNALSLRIIAVQNKNRITSACKEHAAVIQAIYERNAKKAVKYMQEHLNKAKEDIFESPIFKD
ncbi:GntR family transcriptional regulator [Peribacillus butanolivorans]|uniref:GntR family transcriptional regulator n=1 Tax=Peribacillus butanolivorans TaxID=421767 RepID=UPI00365BC148